MKIDVISENTLKVTLSELDMNELDIPFSDFSCYTSGGKASLARILRFAEQSKSFRFPSGSERLFVEAFPRCGGGCLLYISASNDPKSKKRDKNELLPVVCRLSSFDDAVRLCSVLYRLCKSRGIKTESGVFSDGREYRLAVSAESRFCHVIEHCMGEFGDVLADKLEYALTAEHFGALCGTDALERMSRLA